MATFSEEIAAWQVENGFSADRPPEGKPLTDRGRDRIEKHRDRLHGLIESLPAGALNAGMPRYDPRDRQTWYLSPDENMRNMAEQLYGITAETADNRLSLGDRDRLHKLADAEADGVSQTDLDFADEFARRTQSAQERLWRKMRIQYPHHAANPDAVRAAARQLMANSGMNQGELLLAMEENADEILSHVVNHIDFPDPYGQGDAYEDDNRTMGLAGGSGGYSSPAAAPQPRKPSSMSDAIRGWQQKWGFTR